jgi:hypothetical protein
MLYFLYSSSDPKLLTPGCIICTTVLKDYGSGCVTVQL